MIVLRNVTKEFRAAAVLSDVSFRVDPKEFVCLTGPSGAGKTAILSLLIGASVPTRGSVEVDGVDLRRVPPDALQLYRRRIGVVFQDLKLLPNRTVEENVAFPLEVAGVPESVLEKRVKEVLEWTGLLARAAEFPAELSGGERARCALARAIVHKPLIILADEPTGNVDPMEAVAVLQLFRRLHDRDGTTIILATHDAALVDTLQTRVLRFEKGRVIRDSIGGYEKAKRTQPKAAVPQGEHHVFSAPEAPNVAEEGGSDAGRKVRITAIGS